MSRSKAKAHNDPKNIIRRCDRARNFPHNTCPASRHAFIVGFELSKGRKYPMIDEEPEHVAGSILSVVESLWKARNELAKLLPNPPEKD